MRSLLAATLPTATPAQRLLFGIPFLAVAVIFLYEWLAYSFGWVPTLSHIMAYRITSRGPGIAFVWGLGVGAVGLVLFLHFTGLLRWWTPD